MPRNYSRKLEPATSDLALIWDETNSDWRLTTLSAIKDLFEANEAVITIKEMVSQYSSPLTGATVTITDGGSDADNADVHLMLTPAGTLATLTITLPIVTGLRDKQEVLVTCTQIITTLTIDANGASSVVDGPAAMTAGGYFRLKYDILSSTWYRVG